MKKRIIFYGGRQTGMIVMLSLKALNLNIEVIPEDEIIQEMALVLGLRIFPKLFINENTDFISKNYDILICCHGRKRIPKPILDNLVCFNIHPCLYRYKGAEPIKRLLADNNTKASVASHYMTETIDGGEVILEIFKEVEGKTQIEVYNELYPLYAEVVIKTINKLI